MTEIILAAIIASFSFTAGAWFKAAMYDSENWEVYRYDPKIMGYRALTFGDRIHRGDLIVLGHQVNTLSLPIEGIPMHDMEEHR